MGGGGGGGSGEEGREDVSGGYRQRERKDISKGEGGERSRGRREREVREEGGR